MALCAISWPCNRPGVDGNVGMSRPPLVELSEMLRPYIEGWSTVMQSAVNVLRKAACIVYLRDDGRLRKTANAFGLSQLSVSQIVRQVCEAITVHLGPRYIRLPETDGEAEEPVAEFLRSHRTVWTLLTV